jgi:outer membrane protein OmpA-like peptidoglycan-associated protein
MVNDSGFQSKKNDCISMYVNRDSTISNKVWTICFFPGCSAPINTIVIASAAGQSAGCINYGTLFVIKIKQNPGMIAYGSTFSDPRYPLQTPMPTLSLFRFFARPAVSLSVALLLAACTGAPVSFQENEGFSQSDQGRAGLRPDAAAWAGLRQNLEAALSGVPGHHIDTLPDGLRVTLPAADGFSPRRAALTPKSTLATALPRIAPVLKRHPEARLQILAYTSSTDSEMYNLRLTIQRADAVMEQLRREGIEAARMGADGRGETEPVADNATPEGRARNQRVEILLSRREGKAAPKR